MFEGTLTALITPMRDGRVDLDALRQLVDYQIAEGIGGLVPCGTTGETPTLSDAEQRDIIRAVVEQAAGRVPVVAGAGANSSKKAVEQTQRAADLGVDATLQVTPYYNKPGQGGLRAHFEAIADASPIPLVLYNVPGRTGCDMLPETIAALADHPKVAAVKEATGSITRAQHVIAACQGKEIEVLSGDDATAMALTLVGGSGVISVVSNVAPNLMSRVITAAREGQIEKARELNYRLLPLMDLLFCESNPIPVKAAMAHLGFGANELRLPLQPLATSAMAPLLAEMAKLGIAR